MNKKQKRLRIYSDGYLPFSLEDSHPLNYNRKSTNPLVLQIRQENDFQKTHELNCCINVDGFSTDTNNLNGVAPLDDHHSAVFKHLNGVKYVDMLKSDENAEDLLSAPELECLMVMNDYVNHDKHEPADLVPLTSSEMFQEGRNVYIDEDVLDYEPELIVCYKEVNYKFVKDICVDEGIPLEDKGLINLHLDNCSGPCANDYVSNKEPGDLDFELLIRDEISLEADADVHNTKKCLAKEDINIDSPFAREPKCLADLMNMGDQNHDSMLQASEKSPSKKVENDSMQKESIITKLVHMENFSSKSFLMKSLSNQEYEAQHLKKEAEHADMDDRHQESVDDSEYGDYSNNPSIECEVVSSSLNGSSMTIHQETESYYEEDCSANTFKAQRAGMVGNTGFEVQNADVEESSVNIHPQLIASNNIVDSENPFPLNECKNLSESKSIQKSHQQLQHESGSSYNRAHYEVPSSGVNDIGGNASSATPGEVCDGEVIFCNGSGQITYSGPAAISGSTSMRSDSSTTSARSFAFPVLQTEWNSSPVKMGNTNRRRFRKKRGSWKRGMLCCRF